MDPEYDIEKFLPAMIARLGAGALKVGKKGVDAAKKVGVAAKNSKMGQNMANLADKGKEMKETVDAAKESPMGQAMGSLQEAAARNKQDTARMEQEARERMMSGASTGSTTTRS
jgi:ribosomal protein L12E/L44/L45/RPP1/RPP2